MSKGRVKKTVFPGGNTCLGFYSFFNYIVGQEARRVFILKGGPGTGKSTLMKQIGEELLERGLDLEYFRCSSDPDSLDALAAPDYRVAILDGTDPHVVDPAYPGAVDEIVNLNYWDQAKLTSYKEKIINLKSRVKHCFAACYNSLRMAKLARDEERDCREQALDQQGFHRLAGGLFRQIFGEESAWGEGTPRERHLFASALTPRGIMHYVPSLLDEITMLYLIEGEPGSGKEMILRETAEYAYRAGLAVEVYHCAFDPAEIDLVVLPDRKIAILKRFPELNFDVDRGALPNLKSCEKIDCQPCLGKNALKNYAGELQEARELFDRCLQRGLAHLQQARALYIELEGYYHEAMDFQAVDRLRKEVLARMIDVIGL